MFDLILPVHNSLEHVRSCLRTILKHSTLPYRLYVVNDCSDDYTSHELEAILAGFQPDSVKLINNQKNIGYLLSCNSAISEGCAPYTVLINSDTLVTKGYLEKVKNLLDKEPQIGVISAVSNWANWTRIPFPTIP